MTYVVIIWRGEHWEEYFSSRKLKEARQWAQEAILLGCGSTNIKILNGKNQTLKLMRGH
tara:strand:+ start:179 stop:355 length:177 start_codon:yes stop_codon:yes gene_type:complete